MGRIRKHIQSYYSHSQVHTYLQAINFPNANSAPPVANLETLELLVRLHLLTFPFENSRLHYTQDHIVDVSVDVIYRRLVEHRQGGSWCCGQNGLLLGILRGLGYRAYSSPARVNKTYQTSQKADYTRLSHLVLIVELDGERDNPDVPHDTQPYRYLVDVGFGGSGLVRPIRLEIGQTVPGSAPPEEHRLMRAMHPESSLEEDEASREWVLQYRCGSHQPDWTILFLFSGDENYPGDWVASSQWLSQYPVEPFKSNVTVVRHFIVEGAAEGKGVALGRLIMMGNKVQRRIGDRSDTVHQFTTESERVQLLRTTFNITVEEDEIHNILGTAAALPIQ